MVGSIPAPAKPARDQHQFARGQRRDVLHRQLLRCPGDRIDEPHHPLRRTRAQDGEAALLQAQDRWIRNCAETLGGHPAKDARLQLKEIRAANDILNLRTAAGQGKLMPQLHRVASDAVISRHQAKAHTARSPIIAPAPEIPSRSCPSEGFIRIISLFSTFVQRRSCLYKFEVVASIMALRQFVTLIIGKVSGAASMFTFAAGSTTNPRIRAA